MQEPYDRRKTMDKMGVQEALACFDHDSDDSSRITPPTPVRPLLGVKGVLTTALFNSLTL